jgi:transcriptional regulator with XRE-family HTH domain
VAYTRNNKRITLLGNRIRELRIQKGLTIEELAHLADISFSQLARIERGEINTSISHLFVIAEALDMPVNNLFEKE